MKNDQENAQDYYEDRYLETILRQTLAGVEAPDLSQKMKASFLKTTSQNSSTLLKNRVEQHKGRKVLKRRRFGGKLRLAGALSCIALGLFLLLWKAPEHRDTSRFKPKPTPSPKNNVIISPEDFSEVNSGLLMEETPAQLEKFIDGLEFQNPLVQKTLQNIKDYVAKRKIETPDEEYGLLLTLRQYLREHQAYHNLLQSLNTPEPKFVEAYADLLKQEGEEAGVTRLGNLNILSALPNIDKNPLRGLFCLPFDAYLTGKYPQASVWTLEGENFSSLEHLQDSYGIIKNQDFKDVSLTEELAQQFTAEKIAGDSRNLQPSALQVGNTFLLGYLPKRYDEKGYAQITKPVVIAFKILERDIYGGITFVWKALSKNLPSQEEREKAREKMYTSSHRSPKQRESENKKQRIAKYIEKHGTVKGLIDLENISENDAFLLFARAKKIVDLQTKNFAQSLLKPEARFVQEYIDFEGQKSGVNCVLAESLWHSLKLRAGPFLRKKMKPEDISLPFFYQQKETQENAKSIELNSDIFGESSYLEDFFFEIQTSDLREVRLDVLPDFLTQKKSLLSNKPLAFSQEKKLSSKIEPTVGKSYALRIEDLIDIRPLAPHSIETEDGGFIEQQPILEHTYNIRVLAFQVLDYDPYRITFAWRLLDEFEIKETH